METLLQQMFMTIIAAFAFFILIAKIVSTGTNIRTDHHPRIKSIRDLSNVSDKQLKSSKKKSTKKVRFAVDHEEFFVNKTVAEPSVTKSIVLENNCNEIEDGFGNETTDYDINSVIDESVSTCVDYDRSKENVANCNEIQMCVKLVCDDVIDEAEKEKVGLISEEDDSSDDDDWEGVERSDLEKVFAMAADYCKLDDNLESLESDVQMQLYALHKVATEGPCREAQPMALKVAARAKWNSWQKLGNMSPDVAMERYIALLSEFVPGWSQEIHSVDKH